MIPPAVLVGVLLAGYSATYSAVAASASCIVVASFRRKTRLGLAQIIETVDGAVRQAAQVAVPIAAIGIIIAVAIQSNLALKFSSQLIADGGGTIYGAMGFIILGCIIMGMGLPTVAAYIIGAILFVPALLKLGIPEMSAHFFVMYYCVLSMVTPPVALASYTAAGIAGAGVMQTSLLAFRLSLVSFFIPFAFAFDPRLLGQGSLLGVLGATVSLLAGTVFWVAAPAGYLGGPLNPLERLLSAVCGLGLIFSVAGSTQWLIVVGCSAVVLLWILLRKQRLRTAS